LPSVVRSGCGVRKLQAHLSGASMISALACQTRLEADRPKNFSIAKVTTQTLIATQKTYRAGFSQPATVNLKTNDSIAIQNAAIRT
jgi:hypothetical protein